MQESENISQLRRMCKVLATIARILQILAIAMLALFLLGMFAYAVLHAEIFTAPFLGRMKVLWFSVKTQDVLMSGIGIFVLTILGMLALGLVIAFFTLLQSTFAQVAQSYSPFTEEIRKKLLALAVIAVVLALFGGNLLSAIFETIALVAFFLMFDYACELQLQSDETL
ncbi:hypothetical protein HMPREF9069_00130 [Atopobium sp. oral taxon 810 str. F0209]|nr:hypothetical protein HMPREF9069_00130 [Atopobium sp. oral taxon 810 str. F0209]